MTETIGEISQEIDTGKTPEQIEVQVDPETGKFVEFHRETKPETA